MIVAMIVEEYLPVSDRSGGKEDPVPLAIGIIVTSLHLPSTHSTVQTELTGNLPISPPFQPSKSAMGF